MGRTLRGIATLAIVALALVPAPVFAVTRSIAAQESNPEANLPFLFAAYAVVFLGLAGYILVLSRRQRELEREIKALRQSLEEQDQAPTAGPTVSGQ